MTISELISALKKFETESQFTKKGTTIGETILKLNEKINELNISLEQTKAENKKIKKALKAITAKYSDNSSYYEDHLIQCDEAFKNAIEALK